MAVERIFLIGMMGSGKSYWAAKIAKWIKAGGYDLDDLIEMVEETTISAIFAEEGEVYFRKLETKILKWFGKKEICASHWRWYSMHTRKYKLDEKRRLGDLVR